MANGGFKNLAIKGGRSDKGVTGGSLQTKGNKASPSNLGMSMGGHTRKNGHANTSFTGKITSASSKACK